MAEGGIMEDVVKTGVGEDTSMCDKDDQPFALLLRVTRSNGKPLLVGVFTGWAMSQMLHEVAGVIPKEVVVMNDQEVVMEFEKDTPIIKVSKAIPGLFHWGGQSISVDSLVAKWDLVADIVRKCEVSWDRQRNSEWEHHWI